MKVLVIGNVHEEALAILREFAELAILPEPASSEEIIANIVGADAMLHKIGKIGPEELKHQTGLRIIARHGVGLDYLDLEAIKAHGIPVSITLTANSDSVAEAAIGLMLTSLRHFGRGEAMLKRDREWKRESLMGRELGQLTVGLIGYGRTGHRVAKLLDAFGSTVLVHDVNPKAALADNRTVVPLETLLASSDVISLHLPLIAGTRGMFGAEIFARCKKGVVFVNTARGGLFNTAELVDAVRAGQVGGVATDCFETEPPDYDSPMFRDERIITTPHLAAMTLDAQIAMGVTAAQEIRRVLVEGLPPTNNVLA